MSESTMNKNTKQNPPRTCPYCDEPTKKLPAHIVKCDAVPPTEGYE